MKKFRDLRLEQTRESITPTKEMPFRWMVYHVKELFMEFLPKIEINDSSVIQIDFGIRGDEPEFDSVLGSTNIFIENFDFDAFYRLDKRTQEHMILEIIVDSLCEISQRKGKDPDKINIIKEAANKVTESNFNLTKHIKRLSKKCPNKTYSINVYKCINLSCGEAWNCEIENIKSGAVTQKWMTKVPNFIDRQDWFKKITVTDTEYTVFDKFSKIVFQTNWDG